MNGRITPQHALANRQLSTRKQRKQDSQRVTLIGAGVNLLLSLIKIVVGWLAHSQALIADGIHSLSDLLSDGLVWYAAHHAAEAPDAEHPYGHGRFETLATLALGGLLLLVAIGIIWDASSRLFAPERLLTPGVWALYAAAFSIVAKEALYHYTMRVSRHHKSELLRANAWHHRSDAISSVVVLIGVGGTMAGLPYLDAIAAVIVGVMIAHVSWKLSAPAIRELSDAGLEQERVERIRATILEVSGVRAIHMLRTRKSGGQASMDVHLLVAPWLSVSEGHMISQAVNDRLLTEIDELADVTVHVDPEDDEIGIPCQGLPLRNEAERLLAQSWDGVADYLNHKRLLLHYLDGQIDVEVQFPLASFRSIDASKQLKQQLQQRLAAQPLFRYVTISYHP